jgi:hypothetical protein
VILFNKGAGTETPMARTLDQILAELAPAYDPQVANIQKRQQGLPGQIQAEEQGLQAKQTDAFDQILGGARRRGLGFSGIPLGEQAKYTATEFLPAMARLRQSGREQAMSLEDAILGIRERQRGQAQNIYQTEQDRAFQREMMERQMAEQRRAAAAQARATMGALGGFGQQTQPQDPMAGITGQVNVKGASPKVLQSAFNDVATRVQSLSPQDLWSDYLATASSAKFGNQKDLAKLQIYRILAPQVFRGNPYSWEATGGVGNVGMSARPIQGTNQTVMTGRF